MAQLIFLVLIVLIVVYSQNVLKNTSTDLPLKNDEKWVVWVTCFFNPVVGGAIYYYSWKNKLPTKAKQVNKASWVIFIFQMVVWALLVFLVNKFVPVSPPI